jgi:hypothetical protein
VARDHKDVRMAGEIGNDLVRQAVRQSSRAIVDIEALEGKHRD